MDATTYETAKQNILTKARELVAQRFPKNAHRIQVHLDSPGPEYRKPWENTNQVTASLHNYTSVEDLEACGDIATEANRQMIFAGLGVIKPWDLEKHA